MKFLIVTPAHNESEYITALIDSMVAQDLRPARWVIVDDGSTDGMADLVEPYVKRHPWISLLRRESNAEQRSGGSKVVRAFYAGYEQCQDVKHDVVMKLDADLTLPSDYLSSLKQAFEADKELGLCGGYCVIPVENGWQREASHAHHVRGALKAYRADCFYEIGGIMETWNWDGMDNMKAMHLGWNVRTIEKEVKHHRPTSAAYEPLQHAYRSGCEAYRTGSDFGLALIRGIAKLGAKPYLSNSIQYMKGFLDARKAREPKVVDAGLERFIRRFTYRRLLGIG